MKNTAEAPNRRGFDPSPKGSRASSGTMGLLGAPPRLRALAVGFTLLEVLIAIVILVLAIAAIAPLFAVGATSHRRGVDQSELAWIAPRIAARIQERLYEQNPREIRGFVKPLPNGSLLIDDAGGKLPPDEGASYGFHATFTPIMTIESQKDPMPNTCFVLKVQITYREGGEGLAETYETVVLRKLLR